MTGKVFVSCGQAKAEEKEAAERVRALLRDEFCLESYLAFRVQSLDDIMVITKELRSCDYYLFIDFKRHSTFTHQELALAHHLGFGGDIVALRQRRARKMEGFLRYVLSNPAPFDTIDQLIEQVRELVRHKGWNRHYSRNLVVGPSLTPSGQVTYGDHTGQSVHESWRAKIENRRPDTAAVGAICILDTIRYPSGDCQPCKDRGYLKWVGHGQSGGYDRTILPNSSEEVAVVAVNRDQPGLFLLSTRDVYPREPIVTEDGDYELNYKLFARDFPVLEFTVKFHLQWQPTATPVWTNLSKANLNFLPKPQRTSAQPHAQDQAAPPRKL